MKIEEGRYYRTRDGRKVGPVTACHRGAYVWEDATRTTWNKDGFFIDGCHDDPLDLIAEWVDDPPSPVRTVTRKVTEIVAGQFGDVTVCTSDGKSIQVLTRPLCYEDELRAAASIFTQLADALNEQTSGETR